MMTLQLHFEDTAAGLWRRQFCCGHYLRRMLSTRKTLKSPRVRVLRAGERFEVWLYQAGRRRELTGSVDARLASDAGRRGQDLVGDLIDQSLKEADRRSLAY